MGKGLKSKKVTSSAVVTTAGKSGLLWGYNLIGGTTGSKAIFENGGSGGADTWTATTLAGTAVGDVTVSEHFSKPVVFTEDIFCTLSGTGAFIYVIYEEIEG
jgi:hypothetical protein